MKERTANFFWQGPALGIQEHVCIASFVKHGFVANVYTYNDELCVPVGAIRKDAADILPRADLLKYTQAGMSGNLAAFSDAFRYHLLKKHGGWWFDSDVLCIASVERFIEIFDKNESRISFGYQSKNIIASGVLHIDDDNILNSLINKLEEKGTNFGWGSIGPLLVSDVIISLNLHKYAENKYTYYPIHYNQIHKMYDPLCNDWCEDQIRNSLAIHLWNEVRRRTCIPGNMLPPEGSFLYRRFLDVCPELASLPTIPLDTLSILFDYADMKARFARLAKIEKTIMANPIAGNLIRLRRNLHNFFYRKPE